MNRRTIIVAALASLALGCDDRFIKHDVTEIRVHDIKMNMRYSITNSVNINAARSFLNQPDTWAIRIPRPAVSFVDVEFFDSSTNLIVTLHGTGVDLWCGSAHRKLTEQESLQFFTAIELDAHYNEMKNKSPNHGLESTGAPPAAGSPETHP